MDVRRSFEQSLKGIKEAREQIKHGFPCECGGIMNETGNVATCIIGTKFVDKYELKCDKCGKLDFFRAEVKHLTKLNQESETPTEEPE